MSKIVKTLRNCQTQKLSELSKIVNSCQNCQKIVKIVRKTVKIVKIDENCQQKNYVKNFQNVIQVMSPHHSDQMSQRSLYRVKMSKSKVTDRLTQCSE